MEAPRLILRIEGESAEYELEPGQQTLGRSKSCDIYIPDGSLSKTHAWIVLRDGELLVRDAGSRNGVFLDGEQIEDAVVKNGDVVCFGKVRCEVAGLPQKPAGGPILRLVDTEFTWPLGSETITIGSHRTNDVVIEGEGVSRYHAEICCQGDAYWIQDLGARNGVILRGAKIQNERLEPGDEIQLGTCVLRMEMQQAPVGEALREVFAALRKDPVGTFKSDKRVRIGAVATIAAILLGAMIVPGSVESIEVDKETRRAHGHWLDDGTQLLLAGSYADARSVFRKAKVSLPQGEQKTPQVLERISDMWATLESQGHDRFRWSKAEDMLGRTAKLKGLSPELRDWLAAKTTFVELNKKTARVMEQTKQLASQAETAAADREIQRALELFKKAATQYGTVPSDSMYAAQAQDLEEKLSLKAFQIIVASIERGTRGPRPDWYKLQDRIGKARDFAMGAKHRNRLRELYEVCRINRNDEDRYVKAHELIGTEQTEAYDEAERLLREINPRSRIHKDAQAYLNWLEADRYVRKAQIAYDRADGRAAFDLLKKALEVPALGESARKSISSRRMHWSRVTRAYDRGMAADRDLDEALEELSEVVRLEQNAGNLYRVRAKQELRHIRQERVRVLEKRLFSGLEALRQRKFVRAIKEFDAVRADPVHTRKHLRTIQQAVARVNAEDDLLRSSKKHLIRDNKRRFAEIRDNFKLLAKWLPEAHADRKPAQKHLVAVTKRIRSWKMK